MILNESWWGFFLSEIFLSNIQSWYRHYEERFLYDRLHSKWEFTMKYQNWYLSMQDALYGDIQTQKILKIFHSEKFFVTVSTENHSFPTGCKNRSLFPLGTICVRWPFSSATTLACPNAVKLCVWSCQCLPPQGSQ